MNSSFSFTGSLTRPFLTGVMALLPVAITVAIFAWIANVVSDLVGPGSTTGLMLKRSGWNFGSTEAGAYLGGALFAIVLIYVLGIFIQTILKDRWSGILSDISSKVPVVGTIYDASSKVVQMLTPGESPTPSTNCPAIRAGLPSTSRTAEKPEGSQQTTRPVPKGAVSHRARQACKESLLVATNSRLIVPYLSDLPIRVNSLINTT